MVDALNALRNVGGGLVAIGTYLFGWNVASPQLKLSLLGITPLLLAVAVSVAWRWYRGAPLVTRTTVLLGLGGLGIAGVVGFAALESVDGPRQVAEIAVPTPPVVHSIKFDPTGQLLVVESNRDMLVEKLGSGEQFRVERQGLPSDNVAFSAGQVRVSSVDEGDVRRATIWSYALGSDSGVSTEYVLPPRGKSSDDRICSALSWVPDAALSQLAIGYHCFADDGTGSGGQARGGYVELVPLAAPGAADARPPVTIELAHHADECVPRMLAFNSQAALIVVVVDCPTNTAQRYFVERFDYDGHPQDGPSALPLAGSELLGIQEAADGRALLIVRNGSRIELRRPMSDTEAVPIAQLSFDALLFARPGLVAFSPDGAWAAQWRAPGVALLRYGVWMFGAHAELLDGVWALLTGSAQPV